jgi:hypothetical protein
MMNGPAFYLGLGVFSIVVAVKLAKRLGYDGAAGLLMIFPVVAYVVLAVWAFIESPNERKIRELRRRVSELEAATGESRVALLEAADEGKGGDGDGSVLGQIGSIDLG